MTQSGGSAAINGFLYQILNHLDWLVNVRLTGKLNGQQVKDGCLILEPRAGGDAHAHASALYLVEQYKTRTKGTWSLSEVKAVLRDLRKSVPVSLPNEARYRFVTDGRPGQFGAFQIFISSLNTIESPDDLNNDEKRQFGKSLCLGDREFFDHVTETTRTKDSCTTTAEEGECVFHLLRRFEMKFLVGSDKLAKAVDARLRPLVCNLGDEVGMRRRLVGDLMERLSAGESRLRIDDLDTMFREAGLSPDRPRKLAVLSRKLGENIHRGLRNRRYRPERDVRDVPHWPEAKPILVIAGESGVGKSWQLSRYIEASVSEGELVVSVRATDTAEDILRFAAREIWQIGLGETSEKTLQGVSNFFRDLNFRSESPMFTIAVDDIQSVDLARNLIRQDWKSLCARLVLTVPVVVARTLDLTDGNEIHLHCVDEFSIDELDALLKMSGHRWADLHADLKWLLRKPILASLFLDLSVSSVKDAPQSEYEIFNAFWDRIAVKCNPGDTGIVAALAELAIKGTLYPLPRKHWGDIGLENDNLATLEATGWLNSLEQGEIVFAHDRLLNWAVAKYLSRRFLHGDLSVQKLFDYLTDKHGRSGSSSVGRLGYVPMDTLWLLAAEDVNTGALGQIVEKMEDLPEFGSYLYTNLLTTLGQRAIPVLLQRLEAITGDSIGNYRVGMIGDAFATLARQESVDIRPEIDSLLHSPSWDRQSVAVKALMAAPDPRHMDRLWEIHQQRLDALEHNADRRVDRGYEATFSALRVGVAFQPKWLQDRIRKADVRTERVSELGYLLSGLYDQKAAEQIWWEVHDVLMQKIPAGNPRCLLHCISRFLDHGKTDFVVKHLTHSGNLVSAAALVALAVLDPLEAIDWIANLDDEQIFFRNEWLPLLFWTDFELAQTRTRELGKSGLTGQKLIEDYFGKFPADLDEATLDVVLRARKNQFCDHIREVTTKDLPWPYSPLVFWGRMCRPTILKILQDEAGGELESMVVELACSRLRGNSGAADPLLEAARRVLILFAGEGISTLINRELDSEHYWVRHHGLNWAPVRGNEGTIERLSAIAQRPIPCDSAGDPDSEARHENYQAMIGLAALGADEILVEILSKPATIGPPVPLADFREHRGRMSKALTDQARGAMRNTETSEDVLGCSLTIAWVSGDSDLIPDVRAVLDRVDPESQNAVYACIALQRLGDGSSEFARMAERLVYTNENTEQGLDALIALGAEGVESLGRWVNRQRGAEHHKHREMVIRGLYVHPEGRNHAVEAAVEHCLKNFYSMHSLYEIAAESGDPRVQERIMEESFAENRMNAPLDAIRGLAKFDINRAAEAVELGLSSHPNIERELCRLLVQIAPEMAGGKLVDAAIALERDSLSRAVGQALRRAAPKAVAGLVGKQLHHGTETERKVVSQIAGWLPVLEITEALEQVADREISITVRRAALEGLYRHREDEAIRGLFSEFQSERCLARRWSLFVAILDTADPNLLTDREDSLWLGQILTKDVPYAFDQYAWEVIEKRKRKGLATN